MIENKTKGRTITKGHVVCSSVLSKAKGLMFSKKIVDNGLIFPFDISRRIDLHMFFVFYPIDVLFLDSQKMVVESIKGFAPFSIYLSKSRASYVIELPEGTIEDSGTTQGDFIDWD